MGQPVNLLATLVNCPVENVLGRVQLIPFYLNENTCNTIPYKYRGEIPSVAAADSRPDNRTESRLDGQHLDVAIRKSISR